MNDRDGLYLDGTWVAPAKGIATSFVANDITKPDTLQTSHTNTFNISDTVSLRLLTQNAEQLDSGSTYPYKPIAATLIVAGNIVFRGFAELVGFDGSWESTLYEEKLNLFNRIDRSIRTVDLARFNHPWTLDTINALAGATDGICYPLIDYGLLQNGITPLDAIFPALFVSSLLNQLLGEEGYRLVGDLPNDALYKAMGIAFSEDEPTSRDESFRDDRRARVARNGPDEHTVRNIFDPGDFIDRIQPYDLDNQPENGLSQGVLHNYNTQTYAYVCDTNMRVLVQAVQLFKVRNLYGSVEVILAVEKNGQVVASEYFSSPAGYNLLFLRTDQLALNATVTCQAGDQLRIRLTVRRRTAVGPYDATIYNTPDNSWSNFVPDLSIQTGDTWAVARNLPDMTGLALIKGIAFAMSGSWYVNTLRKEIFLVTLNSIIENTNNAIDWSDRVNTRQPVSWSARLSPYAQANYLKYKEVDETRKLPTTVSGPSGKAMTLAYGDGLISVNAPVLDSEQPLFEMPFAASINSQQEIAGYGRPILIPTRSVSGSGTSLSITKSATSPRLILIDTTHTQSVTTKVFADDGQTIIDAQVTLRPCWFGARPNAIITTGNRFCLCFSSPTETRGETSLIERYYGGLFRVLRRMRVLKVSMLLKPSDIAELDFRRPIRLKRLQLGSLILSDGYYYLNRIDDYEEGYPTTVTLIAY